MILLKPVGLDSRSVIC